MGRRFGVFLILASVLMVFFSCNIFSPTEANRHPEKDRYRGYALVLEGKIKMQEGEFTEALRLFNEAIATNDSLSEAYFYQGKCILRIYGVDLRQVWSEVNPARGDTMAVPFLYRSTDGRSVTQPIAAFTLPQTLGDTADTLIDSVFLERKRIYDAVCQAIKGLDTIYYRADRMDGVIQRTMWESDYLIEISIRSVLGMIDLNDNDSLDFKSDERKAYRILCQDIPSLDSMDLDSLKTISRDPQDINDQLKLIVATVGRADTSYNNFAAQLHVGAQKTATLDTSMASGIGEMIRNFKDILPFFYYNDYLDNDNDWYNTDTVGEDRLTAADTLHFNVRKVLVNGQSWFVRQDRMIWVDWDFDHKIDVDQAGTLHIGDATHRAQYPRLYVATDSANGSYHRYQYRGPHTWEFIGGDWGVDEEIMDGHDNDQDGLTDEDTRIVADTLDDDGDNFNTDPTPLIGSTFNPMGRLTDDFVIQIGGTAWDSVGISARFLATHALHLRVPSNRKLPRYTGVYAGDFVSGDYGVDEEWFDGIDNDNDGLVDEDIGEFPVPIALRSALLDSLVAHQLR
jgi:tetratricopeptide (TPR) repeat protein